MLYLLIYTILIFLSIYITIKLKYRFWSSQPIFHTYNLIYWFHSPGILQNKIPEKNKFYNENIICKKFNKFSNYELTILYAFLQMHYCYLENTTITFNKRLFMNLFSKDSIISLQYSLLPKKLLGIMTSRPLDCIINNKKLSVSYLDHLCIHGKYKKKGLACKQIYTHYLKSRKMGNNEVFIYKNYKRPSINVPITIFNSYMVSSTPWVRINLQLPNTISTHIIGQHNCELIIHFMREIKSNFKCFISPKTFHLSNFIKNEIIIPTVLMDNNTVVAATFFKYNNLSINGEKIIECVASYCRLKYKNIFMKSLSNSIVLLKQKYKFKIIIFENISHNYYLIKRMLERNIPKRVYSAGFYFYNFAYTPFFSPNVFLLA